LRVVIADDHPPQRLGVRAALEAGGFEVVAEAGDGAAALEAAKQHNPDVCLLDIHMPGNGIRTAAKITSELPEVAVVMLTVSRNDDDLFDALRAGASGYLLKDIDPARLPEALRGVLQGEAALPRSLVSRLMDEFRGRERKRRLPLVGKREVQLTSKEWEVLDLMREDVSTKEMAERLFVSPVTIRTHVSQIMKKLQVKSRAEALRLLEDVD
jgi:DNA-binding NarL/FixJ family response regulator